MKFPFAKLRFPQGSRRIPGSAAAMLMAIQGASASTCTSFAPGVPLGSIDFTTLKEASGLAVSGLNPGVVWTQNDGSGKRIFAVNLNAELLLRCDFGSVADDVEDMAVGPGPAAGTNYIYLSDAGGAKEETGM